MGTWPGLSIICSPMVTAEASIRDTSINLISTTASGVRAIRSRYATVPVTVAIDGASGMTGSAGFAGAVGSTGAAGSLGATGLAGAAGSAGTTGVAG